MAINGNINYGMIPPMNGLNMQPIGMGAADPTSTYLQNFNNNNSAPNNGYTPYQDQFDAPQMNTGMGAKSGLGMNLGTANLLLSGIGTLGSLWNAWQQNKLAKEQFAFSKGITNTNLANQIKSYNTTLNDKIVSRGFTQGDSPETTSTYIQENSLKDERSKV